jgi:hydroxymethyl cephem carbamoyltransferase
MRVLGLKPGHDSAVALIEDERLVFSFEAEKDSFPRHSRLSEACLLEALELCDGPIDALAIGGWHKNVGSQNVGQFAGYFGLETPRFSTRKLCGANITFATSSHERSHILMAAAMSAAAPLQECVILVWEGVLGAFYLWRDFGHSISRVPVMREPGARFGALYALADTSFPDTGGTPRTEYAGKLMALAGMAGDDLRPRMEEDVVQRLLTAPTMYPFDKRLFRNSLLYNAGADTPAVRVMARRLTDAIYDRFARAIVGRVPDGLPLIISGGCGLNCEWNSRWRASGLFSSVEVFPCSDDSGSAIGTAVDASVSLGKRPSVEWSVYSGSPFVFDGGGGRWSQCPLDYDRLAESLASGSIVPWVQGRAEIGPRALGHRSLLASPLADSTRARLNEIKQREPYRPIAPCCLAEHVEQWFDTSGPDPYMLFFARVRSEQLPAVTHSDGSARLQSVDETGPPALRGLLDAFARRTGVPVLCNTSLNFHGLGFINRESDLFRFAEMHNLADVVVDTVHYSCHDRS